MKEIKSFLAGRERMECAVLLAGSEYISEISTYLEREIGIKKIIITDNPNEIEKDLWEYTDLLFFDQTATYSVIEKASTLKPRCLIGIVDSTKIDITTVWKQYRNTAQELYICVDKTSSKREILHWHRNDPDVDLSVILPVYHVEKYLPQCIESLLAWDVPYVEYIFVIDGSPDQSEALIKKYQEKDKRIRIICKENGGCASARNRGLKEAHGTYVGFVDPDDFIDKTMFEKLLMRAICGGYDYVYCGYQKYFEDTKTSNPVTSDMLLPAYTEGTADIDKIYRYVIQSKVAIWRGIYKKSVLYKNNICFNEHIERYDDLPFKLESLFAARSIACVPEYLYYYRIGRDGQDTAYTDDRLFVHFCIFDYLDRKILETRDQRKVDCLQLVKVNTHKYVYKQITDEWRKEYKKRAKDDIYRNMGWGRTLFLLLRNRIAR